MYRVSSRLNMFFGMLVFFLLDITLINKISIKGARPDILIIFIIFCGLFYGVRFGLESGLILGLVKDALDISIFGINIFIFAILGMICGILSDKIYKENFLTQIIVSFIATFFISKLNLPDAIYTALIAPLVFFILRLVFNFNIRSIKEKISYKIYAR